VPVPDTEQNCVPCPSKLETTAVSSCTPLLQTTATAVDVETAGKVSNTELIDISDDQNDVEATTEQKGFSPKEDATNDDLCYFCRNALFCCHHVMSCVSTVKSNRRNSKFYKNLDLDFLNNFNEASMIAFDLKQLLSPLDDHNVDISVEEEKLSRGHDCEHASEVKSEKYERDMTLNFNLDFSVFERCVFGEEMLPENSTANFKSEMAMCEVYAHVPTVNAGADNILGISAFQETESPILPENKPMQESFSSVSSRRFSNTEHTPVRSRQIETNFSRRETPSNLLISPVSPIFGSVLKKHLSESPILGRTLKNISQNSTRTLPMCSTPKVHKKTLFSRNMVLDTVQEEGGEFASGSSQHLKAQDDGSLVHECEQQLNSPLSEGQALPRPNFDLMSAAQDIGISELGVGSMRNADSFTNSAMHTVTQMLDLVDKELYTRRVEPVKMRRSVQDIVPRTFSRSHVAEGISQEGDKCSDSVNHGSMSNIAPRGKNSSKMVASSSLSSLTRQNIPVDYEEKSKQTRSYLHDSDDDVFVHLALDHSMLTACKQSTSLTSEMQGVNNVEVEPDLIGTSDRSDHEIGVGDAGKEEFDTEFPSLISAAPPVTKISERSTGHRQLTNADSKPSRSCLSLKRKLKDSANNTCTENSPNAVGSKPNVSSSDPEARSPDKERLSRIVGDENQFTEVSVSGVEKQKGISKGLGFEDHLDWCISLDKEKTVPCDGSIASICKDPSSDGSLILKPPVRNRKINISSTSDESRDLSPCSTQSKIIKHEKMKSKSVPLEDCSWFTARKSNLTTSPSSVSSNSPRLISNVKKHNSSDANKSVDSCVPVVKNDNEISSEEDSYFRSPSSVKLKKGSQSKSGVKTDGYEHQRKTTPVKKKLKVSCLLGFYNNTVSVLSLYPKSALLFPSFIFNVQSVSLWLQYTFEHGLLLKQLAALIKCALKSDMLNNFCVIILIIPHCFY
jgi:hypothetical protein